MKFDQIINDLKNKIYFPVYFLSGEEPFYIDVISDYIEENVLSDVEKEFNQTVIYGRDTNVSAIIGQAKRYPMMANYQVVIVKEAQDVTGIEELAAYFEKPLSSTLLVLNYKHKKLDKRKAFYKQIEKNGVFFESAKLYDNQVVPWINNHLKEKGYGITPKANAMLAEFLGTDLSKIVNEISKLMLNIPSNTLINEELVERNIGLSKDYNIFEFQNAIGSRNIMKANRIANYFSANNKENPLVKIVTSLFTYFTKLLIYHQLKDKSKNNVAAALSVHSFFVQEYISAAQHYPVKKVIEIISILREYDLKSKGVNNISTTEGELLREMLFKILH